MPCKNVKNLIPAPPQRRTLLYCLLLYFPRLRTLFTHIMTSERRLTQAVPRHCPNAGTGLFATTTIPTAHDVCNLPASFATVLDTARLADTCSNCFGTRSITARLPDSEAGQRLKMCTGCRTAKYCDKVRKFIQRLHFLSRVRSKYTEFLFTLTLEKARPVKRRIGKQCINTNAAYTAASILMCFLSTPGQCCG